MTPRQLIDLCRATNQPLPSGRKIAEVVERMEEERKALAEGLMQHRTRRYDLPMCHFMRVRCAECSDSQTCYVALAERILQEGL